MLRYSIWGFISLIKAGAGRSGRLYTVSVRKVAPSSLVACKSTSSVAAYKIFSSCEESAKEVMVF